MICGLQSFRDEVTVCAVDEDEDEIKSYSSKTQQPPLQVSSKPSASVFECTDYVSLRNSVSYEKSQEIMGVICDTDSMFSQYTVDHGDSWTENDIAPK